MLWDRKIKYSDYERASQLLGKLFEVDTDVTEEINRYIQHYGVSDFFKNLENLDFSASVFKKLNAVRLVLFGMEDISFLPKEIIEELNKSDEANKGGDKL